MEMTYQVAKADRSCKVQMTMMHAIYRQSDMAAPDDLCRQQLQNADDHNSRPW